MAQAVITWDPPNKMGETTIRLLGQGNNVNAVTESISAVVCEIGGLLATTRHCLAPHQKAVPAPFTSAQPLCAALAPTCPQCLTLGAAVCGWRAAAGATPITARAVAQAARRQAKGTRQH